MDKTIKVRKVIFGRNYEFNEYTICRSGYEIVGDIGALYVIIIKNIPADEIVSAVNKISKHYNFSLESICSNSNFLNVFDSASHFCQYFLIGIIHKEIRTRLMAHFLDASEIYYHRTPQKPLSLGLQKIESYINIKEEIIIPSESKLNKIIRATNYFYIYGVGYHESELANYVKTNIHLIVDVLSLSHLVVLQQCEYKHIYIYLYSHKGQKLLMSHPLITKTIYSIPTYHNYDSSAPTFSDLFPL